MSADLLRSLGSGARPVGIAAPAIRADAPGEPGFAALLERAQRGELASGREVTVGDRAGVELSAEQLERLSIAADRAEAAGARRALVLLDEHWLILDVVHREVTARADLSTGGVLNDIEAVVRAPGGQSAQAVAPLPAIGNASLLKLLSRAGDRPRLNDATDGSD